MRAPGRLWGKVSSLSLASKNLGAGAVVFLIFGGTTLIEVRRSVSGLLYAGLQERALARARALATEVEEPLLTGDAFAVGEKARLKQRVHPDVLYVLIVDSRGGLVAHTFRHGVPPDLLDYGRHTPRGITAGREIL